MMLCVFSLADELMYKMINPVVLPLANIGLTGIINT